MKHLVLAILILAGMISGCAVSGKSASSADAVSSEDSAGGFNNDNFDLLEEEFAEQTVDLADPLEPFNRMMFSVNDTLYFWVAKPVCQTYKCVIPQPARIGVRNFFSNSTYK